MVVLPVALEWNATLSLGMIIEIVLFGGLLLPYLIKEIREGKRDRGPLRRLRSGTVVPGPQSPSGAGDINPGRAGDPAPGEPSGQPDPYGRRAQRNAPPVKS
jgi:hypothetical protein